MVDYWGIHNDQPDIDPLADKAVRIGWDRMSDLRDIAANRDAFRTAVADAYPDDQSSNAATAGTLYRFAHEINVGDIVVSPNRADRTLRIGRAAGPYEYRSDGLYRHWRPVEWLIPRLSRDKLSEAAQNELSSATTLFRLRTSRAEIEHLLDRGHSADRAPDFTWVPFYTELADKLATFRHRRPELLELIWDTAKSSGAERLFRFMQTDHFLDGRTGNLTDTDPFTLYSPFNRGITDANRTTVAEAYRTAFGISAPTPATFDGIPVVNNFNSLFIKWEVDRADDAVDTLWDLFEAQLAYAATQSEANRENLITAFDAAATGQTRMLSMGAYWIRPETFTAFDNVNVNFLAHQHPEFATQLNLRGKISGEDFLANTETIRAWLASDGSPFSSPPELSRAAWVFQGSSENEVPAPESAGDTADQTVDDGPATMAQEVAKEYLVADIVADGSFLDVQLLDSMIESLKSKKRHLAGAARYRQDVVGPTVGLGAVQ